MEINENQLEKMVTMLKENGLKISTMESCSGGALASAITSIEGASQVFSFGAVTYNNEFKLKMGVSPYVIKRYGPYHIKTTQEMAKNAAKFANSHIGVGISGQLCIKDTSDDKNYDDNLVYLSVYIADEKQFYNKTIKVLTKNRVEAKNSIVNIVIDTILEIYS